MIKNIFDEVNQKVSNGEILRDSAEAKQMLADAVSNYIKTEEVVKICDAKTGEKTIFTGDDAFDAIEFMRKDSYNEGLYTGAKVGKLFGFISGTIVTGLFGYLAFSKNGWINTRKAKKELKLRNEGLKKQIDYLDELNRKYEKEEDPEKIKELEKEMIEKLETIIDIVESIIKFIETNDCLKNNYDLRVQLTTKKVKMDVILMRLKCHVRSKDIKEKFENIGKQKAE